MFKLFLFKTDLTTRKYHHECHDLQQHLSKSPNVIKYQTNRLIRALAFCSHTQTQINLYIFSHTGGGVYFAEIAKGVSLLV